MDFVFTINEGLYQLSFRMKYSVHLIFRAFWWMKMSYSLNKSLFLSQS